MGAEIKLVAQFDKDGDGRLNTEERKAARAFIVAERKKAEESAGQGGPRGDRRGGGERDRSGLHGQVNVRGNNQGTSGGAGVGWSGTVGGVPANLGVNVPISGGRGSGSGGMGGGGMAGGGQGGRGGEGGSPGGAGGGGERGSRRGGPPGLRRQHLVAVQPGEKIAPADVAVFPDAPVYAPDVLRTYFLEFEAADWEQELADFYNTDVEVPARLTIDGQVFEGVGVHFRGASSFFTVQAGLKRSLNVSLDYTNPKANFRGVRTLNLLNAHEDPTLLRTVLYFDIARTYLPAPQANHARVVINGENWGVYVNAEQFNKDFVQAWYGTTKGARWKVPGRPEGGAGLAYLGEDPEAYRRSYELKSKEDPVAWSKLIRLCRTLERASPEELEEELKGLLDVEGALRFLALENALINNDGYWIRASDYSLYLDPKGVFHVIPHDANETFLPAGGPGFGRRGGGPGGFGPPGFGSDEEESAGESMPRAVSGRERPVRTVSSGTVGSRWAAAANPADEAAADAPPPDLGNFPRPAPVLDLDPLYGLKEHSKPLRTKLLAVPALREKYLRYVREIATTWLDWSKLGPLAEKYHAAIAPEVKRDTKKLDSFEAFSAGLAGDLSKLPAVGGPGPTAVSLKEFADRRRAYLLDNADIKALP